MGSKYNGKISLIKTLEKKAATLPLEPSASASASASPSASP